MLETSLLQKSLDKLAHDKLSKSPLASKIPTHLCKLLFPKLLHLSSNTNIIPLIRLMVVENFRIEDLFLTMDLLAPLLNNISDIINLFKLLNENIYFKSLHLSKDIPLSILLNAPPNSSKRRKVIYSSQVHLKYLIHLPLHLQNNDNSVYQSQIFQIGKVQFIPKNNK